jgi:hypothetical protein
MRKNAAASWTVGTLVRWAAALVLAWIGSLRAFGTRVLANWADQPWPGQRRDTAWTAIYLALTVVLLIVPAVAWRFLLPRYRWWGIPVTAVFAVATFAAFGAL